MPYLVRFYGLTPDEIRNLSVDDYARLKQAAIEFSKQVNR